MNSLKNQDRPSKDFHPFRSLLPSFFCKVLLSFVWKKTLAKGVLCTCDLNLSDQGQTQTSFEQLGLHPTKSTEQGIQQQESAAAVLYCRAELASQGGGHTTPQPVNFPPCAGCINLLVSLTLPFHYFFFAYKSYFWSARQFFTEGIVNMRFIQLCVIFKSTQLPG